MKNSDADTWLAFIAGFLFCLVLVLVANDLGAQDGSFTKTEVMGNE